MEHCKELKENILAYISNFQRFTWRERIFLPLRIVGRMNIVGFYIIELCLQGKTHEPWLEPYLRVKKDEAFVDAGAGIGYYPFRLSREAGHIFAFEPHPEAFLVLNRRARAKNISCFNVALGDKDALHKLHLFYGYKRSSLKKPSNRYILVQCIRLDEFAPVREVKVGLIKIDVEGYEYEVLQGALKTLRKYRPRLIIEVHGRKVGGRVENLLKELGYETKVLHRSEDPTWGVRYWLFCNTQ